MITREEFEYRRDNHLDTTVEWESDGMVRYGTLSHIWFSYGCIQIDEAHFARVKMSKLYFVFERRRNMKREIHICDLCGKEMPHQTVYDVGWARNGYKYYDLSIKISEVNPLPPPKCATPPNEDDEHEEEKHLDICQRCMQKIIRKVKPVL